ncbi:MAG: hypothetical protein AAF799_08495 [Myxococcota bacterium]
MENLRARSRNYEGLLSDSRAGREESEEDEEEATPIDRGDPRTLDGITNLGSIDEEHHDYLQQRLDAYNRGRTRAFNYHTGVGGVPTMDVGRVTGGGGRGDGRLQFHADGTMTVVDHRGREV